MTIIEKFKQDMIFNSEHILFTKDDDESLGKREQGCYIKEFVEDNHDCICYVFDNGHHYVVDLEEEKMYEADPIPLDYFIHKHIEKIISDFSEKWELTSSGVENTIYCTINEINVVSLIRLTLDRNERIVYLPNIMIPMQYRRKSMGIGKELIAQIYDVCKRFNYRLILVQLVESFYLSLERRGAKIIDFETMEITQNTNLK